MQKTCRICITCDNGYTLSVNGRELGRGETWTRVQEYDAASLLKIRDNVIAVDARNEGGEGTLIAEILLGQADGRITRLGTDATWRAAPATPAGWPFAGFADAAWTPAQVVSPFEDSLWAKHEHSQKRGASGWVD